MLLINVHILLFYRRKLFLAWRCVLESVLFLPGIVPFFKRSLHFLLQQIYYFRVLLNLKAYRGENWIVWTTSLALRFVEPCKWLSDKYKNKIKLLYLNLSMFFFFRNVSYCREIFRNSTFIFSRWLVDKVHDFLT